MMCPGKTGRPGRHNHPPPLAGTNRRGEVMSHTLEVETRKDRKKSHNGQASKNGELKRTEYEEELERLHGELVELQQWVVHKGLKVCVVFEGRDGAGKGGTIKAITERVSPRVFRVVALPAPTEREKSQMY